MTNQGRGHSNRGRGRGRSAGTGKELFPAQKSKNGMSGQKRKKAKDQATTSTVDEQLPNAGNTLALVVSANANDGNLDTEEYQENDPNKKLRTTLSRSADPAAAAEQPRQTQ